MVTEDILCSLNKQTNTSLFLLTNADITPTLIRVKCFLKMGEYFLKIMLLVPFKIQMEHCALFFCSFLFLNIFKWHWFHFVNVCWNSEMFGWKCSYMFCCGNAEVTKSYFLMFTSQHCSSVPQAMELHSGWDHACLLEGRILDLPMSYMVRCQNILLITNLSNFFSV